MSIFRCRFLLTISQNKDVHYLSTFHSNYSGLRALISGGGEHGLVTSRRCPSPLTCSLQLIVVTRRRGGGGHWGWTQSQREGALPPSWDIILQDCRWISYHCGGRSALILYFLAFQNFLIKLLSCFASSHSTIVKLCKKCIFRRYLVSGLRLPSSRLENKKNRNPNVSHIY